MPWQAYHTVWALLIFGWICNYVVRMAFSPLLEPVMAEFGLSHAQGGFLFSVFFYGYVAMQVPAGLLGDRFGRKRVLVIGILLVSGAALVTGLSGTLAVLALARLSDGPRPGDVLRQRPADHRGRRRRPTVWRSGRECPSRGWASERPSASWWAARSESSCRGGRSSSS